MSDLIEPGRQAPAFTLADQDGAKHKLGDLKGTPVVVYFYPKDDTSGCTKEACQFRDLSADFKKAGVAVFGVSPQDEKSKAKFAKKHGLNFPLLADHDAKVSDKYGVWQEKSMYGKKYMGVVRTTYLIDAAGKVAQRWDKVKVPGHAEAVLAAVKAL
ncbi:MAG: thioredoxin-dependent thiol peroxidase [Planctomycetota bacterium]